MDSGRAIGSDRRYQVVNTRITIDPGRLAGAITGLALGPDGSTLLVSLDDGSLRWWDLVRGLQFAHVPDGNGVATALSTGDPDASATVARPDGAVFTVGPDRKRRSISEPVHLFDPGARPALSDSGGLFVYRALNGAWFARPVSGFVFILPDAAHDARPGVSRDGNMLAYVSGEQGHGVTLRFASRRWKPEPVRISCTRDTRITALALRTRHLLVGDAAGALCLWNIEHSPRRVFRKETRISGPINTLALDADGRLAAAGDGSEHVELWSRDGGGTFIRTLEAGRQGALAIDATSGWLLIGGEDGQVAIHPTRAGRADGRPIAQLISTEDGWTVVDAEGRFDGSQDGIDAVAMSGAAGTDNTAVVLPVDAFSATHYEPALLRKVRRGDELLTSDSRNLMEGFSRPPTVSMDLGAPDRNAAVAVTVRTESDYPRDRIRSIRLYHNGKLVAQADGQGRLSSRIGLVSGSNEFRAMAVTQNGVEGQQAVRSLQHAAPADPTADLHVVAIGIDNYGVPPWKLFYATKDAETFTKTIRQRSGKVLTGTGEPAYRNVHVHTVLEGSADRNAISSVLRNLKTDPEDVLVVLFSGHGQALRQGKGNGWEWYMMPYSDEWQNGTSEERLNQLIRKHALSSRELMTLLTSGIKARRVFVVLDACFSGAALQAFDDSRTQKTLRQMARVGGVHVIAASQADEKAKELIHEEHGVLTYILLQGMSGAADSNVDRQVSVREIVDYSMNELVRFTRKHYRHSITQRPVAYSRGKAFGLVGL